MCALASQPQYGVQVELHHRDRLLLVEEELVHRQPDTMAATLCSVVG